MFRKTREMFGAMLEGTMVNKNGNISVTVNDTIYNDDDDFFETLTITKDQTVDERNEKLNSLYDEDTDKYKDVLKHFYFRYEYRVGDANELLVLFQFKDTLVLINATEYDETIVKDIIEGLDYGNHRTAITRDFSYTIHITGELNKNERCAIIELLKEIKITRCDEKCWEEHACISD